MSRVMAGAAVVLCLWAGTLAAIDGDPVASVGAVLLIAFPLIGLVIVRAMPRHTVGWVFLTSGLLLAVEKTGDRSSQFGYRRHWPDHVVHLAAWSTSWSWFPGLFLVITVGMLHFPTGRPLSPRWRWLDVLALTVMALFSVGYGVVAWSASTPELMSGSDPSVTGWRHGVVSAETGVFLAVVPAVLGAVVSLVVRWRRSSGIGRQQIRWVAAAGIAAVVVEVLNDALNAYITAGEQTLLESFGFGLVAIATGVAILRYRLYEIDRIISRTLGWTLVTGLLLGVYVGLATVAGAVIPARYGSVGVAGATLAVAALFVPVRRRIHRGVDRRFDRARYDGTRIVETFAGRVRAEVDPTALHADLLRTVQAAVAPTTASVWLLPLGGNDAAAS